MPLTQMSPCSLSKIQTRRRIEFLAHSIFMAMTSESESKPVAVTIHWNDVLERSLSGLGVRGRAIDAQASIRLMDGWFEVIQKDPERFKASVRKGISAQASSRLMEAWAEGIQKNPESFEASVRKEIRADRERPDPQEDRR